MALLQRVNSEAAHDGARIKMLLEQWEAWETMVQLHVARSELEQ